MGAANRRWRSLVRARMAEMERLAPGRGAGSPGFWDSRARRFAATVAGTADDHPFLARCAEAAGAEAQVLDVGAGTGRFALALAPQVAEVVAVDASAAMLRLLGRQARKRGLANVRCVEGRWEAVDVPAADVVLSSYVLPLVEDAGRFLAKMDQACRHQALLCLGALPTDVLFDPFWRHFHGKPRKPGPTYLDAVAVLHELGISPRVEVVDVAVRPRFRSVQAAVGDYRDNLLLPDTAEVRKELRGLLSQWLVRQDGGFRVPLATMPAAIVSWKADSAARRRRR